MADTLSSVCKAGLRKCVIKGKDARTITNCIRIYESMCKPYRTAEIILLNGDGQVNEFQLNVGDQIDFEIMDSMSQTYSMTCYVTAIPEMINADKLREDQVTVGTVSIAFMRDRADIVQSSHKNTSVTSAAATVHSQYIGTPLKVVEQSVGMIAQDQIGSYISSGDHPFTAIRKILERATYGSVGTGATIYFENRYGAVMAPLQTLVTQGVNVSLQLLQRDTWGAKTPLDMFATAQSIKGHPREAILASKVYHKDTNSESGGAGAKVKAASAAINVIDQFSRIPVMSQTLSVLNGAMGAFIGKHGGIQTTAYTDKARNTLAVDPAINQMAEDNYKARVQDATNFLIKTTIEAGFDKNFTVGNRVDVTLMAPFSDAANLLKGPVLIADCMHEAYFDNRIVSGTTTVRAVVNPDGPLQVVSGGKNGA